MKGYKGFNKDMTCRGMQYEVKEIKTVVVDGKKIKEDTYYALEDGKFVEKGAVEDD